MDFWGGYVNANCVISWTGGGLRAFLLCFMDFGGNIW